MKIKMTYVIGILVLFAIAAGAYFLLQQKQNMPQDQLAKFEYYAEKNLGLNLQQFDSCMSSGKYRSDIQNDMNDGSSYGVQGTPTFFINSNKLVGAVPFSDFKAAIDQALTSMSNPQVVIRTGTNPSRGTANASVVIVEFSDYQCPFCARAEETVKQVLQQFEGKVRIYYRDFPLPIHQYSQLAAEASRCAGEQGKFWEYHDLLFEKQKEWSGG